MATCCDLYLTRNPLDYQTGKPIAVGQTARCPMCLTLWTLGNHPTMDTLSWRKEQRGGYPSRRDLSTEERNAIYERTGGGEAYGLAVDQAEKTHVCTRDNQGLCHGCGAEVPS